MRTFLQLLWTRKLGSMFAIIVLMGMSQGCALFDLFAKGPEFSVSGFKMAVMPFAGPQGESWYGDSRMARVVEIHACSYLKEGGAELVFNKKVTNEIINYTGLGEPDWYYYGNLLKVHYVMVGRLEHWEVGNSKSIGFCPGEATINIEIYDVVNKKLVFQKRDDSIKIGDVEEGTEFFYDVAAAKKALVKKIDKKLKLLFVGSTTGLD